MRFALLAIALIAVTLSGCIQGTDEAPVGDDPAPSPMGITRFSTDGASQTDLPLTMGATIGETVYRATGFSGAEPTMAVTESGTIFATGGSIGIRSMDGGDTWEETVRIGLPVDSPADRAYRSWDPLMWYDKWTERVYYDPMFPPLACTELSWTTDDGETWNRNPPACHPPPMDHQKLFSGPPGPDAPPVAGLQHETVLYQCYNQIVATQCGISYDGGMTWPLTTEAASDWNDGCGGTNGHGTVSDKGIAVVPMGTSCGDMTLAFSHDSGLTWTLKQVPGGLGTYGFDFDVVFDENETLYVLFEGEDFRMYLARTHDYGETWEGPFDVTPPGVASVFFQTMNVGMDGRLAMAFLGTKTHADNPNDAPANTTWHLFIVTAEERNAAPLDLLAYQVDPDEDPMHVGLICTGGIGCETGRDLLEFIDSAVAPDGTFHVIYTDSCTEECLQADKLDVEAKDGRHLTLASLRDWPMRTGGE